MKILKDMREKSGLTQRDIAMKLKYTTPQFISNWERGLSHPPIKDIKTIAKAYKVDADYLFTIIKDDILMKESQKLERWFRGSI